MNLHIKLARWSLSLIFGSTSLAFALQISAAQATTPGGGRQARTIIEEKSSRTPAQRKIDSQLLYLLRRTRPGGETLAHLEVDVEADAAGRVLVDITANVTAKLLSKIKKLGGEITSSFPRYHAVRARVPLEKLESLAGSSDVRFIAPAAKALTNRAVTN